MAYLYDKSVIIKIKLFKYTLSIEYQVK